MKKVSNHNYKKEERSEIISKTSNLEHFKVIFGHSNVYKEIDKFKFLNTNFYPFNYIETEKFGIIFFMKGGSSFIMNTLNLANLTTIDSTINKEWRNLFKKIIRIDNKDVESEYYSEFIKIINGKSKKDLILVTRNPVYKWASGVYQEMEAEYEKSRTIKYFLKEKYEKENISEVIDDLSDDEFEYLCYTLLKSSFQSGEGTFWGHTLLYNEVYYNFLELNPKINKSKLKIIDIDSPNGDLITLLSSYYPEILTLQHTNRFTSHRLQHEKIFNSIQKKIQGNELTLLDHIIKKIQNEHYYYLMLEHKYGEYFIQK